MMEYTDGTMFFYFSLRRNMIFDADIIRKNDWKVKKKHCRVCGSAFLLRHICFIIHSPDRQLKPHVRLIAFLVAGG